MLQPEATDLDEHRASDRELSDDEGEEQEGMVNNGDDGWFDNKEHQAHYAMQDRSKTTKVKGCPAHEVRSAIDDFTNAEGHFNCWRIVMMLFFTNDKTHKWLPSCFLVSTHIIHMAHSIK